MALSSEFFDACAHANRTQLVVDGYMKLYEAACLVGASSGIEMAHAQVMSATEENLAAIRRRVSLAQRDMRGT